LFKTCFCTRQGVCGFIRRRRRRRSHCHHHHPHSVAG
jgi:hypothetical protein